MSAPSTPTTTELIIFGLIQQTRDNTHHRQATFVTFLTTLQMKKSHRPDHKRSIKESTYGHPYLVSLTYIRSILSFPKVSSSNDFNGLVSFSNTISASRRYCIASVLASVFISASVFSWASPVFLHFQSCLSQGEQWWRQKSFVLWRESWPTEFQKLSIGPTLKKFFSGYGQKHISRIRRAQSRQNSREFENSVILGSGDTFLASLTPRTMFQGAFPLLREQQIIAN